NMCGDGLCPALRESTYSIRADRRKHLGLGPALQGTSVLDDAETHKAAANMPHKNWTAPSAPIFRTEFLGRAGQGSSASFETQLLLPVMFLVSVSWVEIPFIGSCFRILIDSMVMKCCSPSVEK